MSIGDGRYSTRLYMCSVRVCQGREAGDGTVSVQGRRHVERWTPVWVCEGREAGGGKVRAHGVGVVRSAKGKEVVLSCAHIPV